MLSVRVILAVFADTIDFVNKNDCGLVLGRLAEQLPDAFCANAYENFCEIAAVRTEEARPCFASDRLREHCFARPGWSNQQHALRQAAPQTMVFARLTQEINNLADFFLGLFNAGNVAESHRRALLNAAVFAAPEVSLIHDERDDKPRDEKS